MTTVKPIVEERQHHSWGLLVQGRPATPLKAELRIGPKDSQSLITHNNGTCLEFGPWVLLIDTTIKDIQSVRIRHDTIGDDVDVFRGFRTIPYSGDAHQHVYPNGEVYDQVPSFYASVADTASMYSTSNKSDIIGETHPGLSSDTRFGVLIPNQNQPQGRGGGTYQRHDRPDRQHGRGNYQGDRGGYAQHLNRRGRRDMQYGRGQGRIGNGRGGSRAGGHHFEGHNHYNGHLRHLDELSLDQHRESRYGMEQNRDNFELAKHRDNLAMSQHRANLARRYDAMSDDGVRTWGERYAEAPIFNAQHAPATGGVFYSAENIRRYGEPPFQEPPVYDGFNEDNPYIPPPHLWDFTPGHDVGVADPVGPDNGRMITGPCPRVVLPPKTSGERTLETDFGESQGFLRANIHPPTPLRPSPGRSPMRTTTDEGSPLVRPRRLATDLPNQCSPGHGHMTSTTARSSPGITFSNSGPFGRSMARPAPSHELNYVGFSINGETPGQMSRTPTPPVDSGRRWFETRQYVPDGSRMSSPGQSRPVHYNGVFTDHRSEDGQILSYVNDLISSLSIDSIFEDYTIQSAAPDNTINIELPLPPLHRALKSAINASSASIRLTKRDGMPVLSLTVITNTMMHGKSANFIGGEGGAADSFGDGFREESLDASMRGDREAIVTQDIPIRILTADSVEGIHEPRVRDPDAHIMLPSLIQLKAISERFTKLAMATASGGTRSVSGGNIPKLELSANMHGSLRLSIATDALNISSVWTGLINPELDAKQLEDGNDGIENHPATKLKALGPDAWSTVRIDGRDWGKVLSVGRLDGRVIACFVNDHALILYVYLDTYDDGSEESVLTYYISSFST
ncbi:hypothetical protein DID88_010180 [Monilinia fructigena]|uniref:Checkpoint protein n=1 Tax=Monilinia fructigena TaxID=38457 RepID=A0A395IKQ7_9HELO|nr:hypothetical protein DID88_010180 [Monilinia fructigena]